MVFSCGEGNVIVSPVVHLAMHIKDDRCKTEA